MEMDQTSSYLKTSLPAMKQNRLRQYGWRNLVPLGLRYRRLLTDTGVCWRLPITLSPKQLLCARPRLAGGDAFDLADIDCQKPNTFALQTWGEWSGGFDLDAISIVNGILE